jgi:ubiquinone/menaquinone biosynthesis C-methylase UbiE
MKQNNISYVYGDLRNTILKDQCFDEIVCISTLEHIGMDNTMLYTKDSPV